MTTDYVRFLAEVLSDPVRGPEHGELITDVASTIVNIATLKRRSGGDPGNINGVVDAQLDRLIAGSSGDQRLALFATVAAFGHAMTHLLGPRLGGPT
jgi:hypothetical protein